MPKIEVALVLGAGGARSLAHVGALAVLREHKIPVNLIVGSSAGSIIGALYADSLDPQLVKNLVFNLKRNDLLDPSYLQLMQTPLKLTGPVQGQMLQSFLLKSLKARNFDELKIPLVVVATNMDNNQIIQLRSGPIAPAVNASSALPPIFSPVEMYGQTLVDGGVIAPVPVCVAKVYQPKVIISVDISAAPSIRELTHTFGLVYRTLDIAYYELSKMQANTADIAIHPDLADYGTFDDSSHLEMYQAGRRATLKMLPAIKAKLKAAGIALS